MSDIHHPYDHLFKAAFSIKEVAVPYIEGALHPTIVAKLQLPKLLLDTTSYISPKLKEYFSAITSVYDGDLGVK